MIGRMAAITRHLRTAISRLLAATMVAGAPSTSVHATGRR
jgi:hypothetical protein